MTQSPYWLGSAQNALYLARPLLATAVRAWERTPVVLAEDRGTAAAQAAFAERQLKRSARQVRLLAGLRQARVR